MTLEQVVDEWNNQDDAGGWSSECQPGQSLDEGGDKGGREKRRSEEGVEQTEESGSVSDMQDFCVKQRVQPLIEIGIIPE